MEELVKTGKNSPCLGRMLLVDLPVSKASNIEGSKNTKIRISTISDLYIFNLNMIFALKV